MQSAEQRHKLIKELDSGPLDPLVAVLKCAAGLMALIVIAVGPWVLLGLDAGDRKATEPPASMTVKALPNSIAESKRVFDERRQGHDARAAGVTSRAQYGDATAAETEAGNRP